MDYKCYLRCMWPAHKINRVACFKIVNPQRTVTIWEHWTLFLPHCHAWVSFVNRCTHSLVNELLIVAFDIVRLYLRCVIVTTALILNYIRLYSFFLSFIRFFVHVFGEELIIPFGVERVLLIFRYGLNLIKKGTTRWQTCWLIFLVTLRRLKTAWQMPWITPTWT